LEGYYQEQEIEPVIERNRITGHKRTGEHTIHYIPFSKEKVDEIISNSPTTDKDGIIYVVKNGPEMRNDKFNYEQFVNLSFAECVYLMVTKKGGPALAAMEQQHQELLKLQQQQTTQKQK